LEQTQEKFAFDVTFDTLPVQSCLTGSAEFDPAFNFGSSNLDQPAKQNKKGIPPRDPESNSGEPL
jgi:hypothetical protein